MWTQHPSDTRCIQQAGQHYNSSLGMAVVSEKSPTVDVIIPLKDRRTIVSCVARLLDLKDTVDTIWLCDGGSSDINLLGDLAQLERQPAVAVLSGEIPGFNKSTLINRGIAHANAEFLLVSDADILWSTAAIEALLAAVQSQPNRIAHVKTVQESNPQSNSLRRRRYCYRSYRDRDQVAIAIEPVPPQADLYRPGCGLICARRRTLLQLGGYKDCFQGWGWEDQDLLMRAEVLGFSVISAGTVTHLSHSDTCRNQFHPDMALTQSRDRNILTCLRQLQAGQFWGSLASDLAVSCENSPRDTPSANVQHRPPFNIQIKLPGGFVT